MQLICLCNNNIVILILRRQLPVLRIVALAFVLLNSVIWCVNKHLIVDDDIIITAACGLTISQRDSLSTILHIIDAQYGLCNYVSMLCCHNLSWSIVVVTSIQSNLLPFCNNNQNNDKEMNRHSLRWIYLP